MPRARSRASTFTTFVVIITVSIAIRSTRADVIIERGALASTPRANPLPALTYADVVAAHVAFPREDIGDELAEDVRPGECASTEGPTCSKLGARARGGGANANADTLVSPPNGRRSRVKVIRLDNVEDLVTYFNTHAHAGGMNGVRITADFGRSGADGNRLREKLHELEKSNERSMEGIVEELERKANARPSARGFDAGEPFDASVKSVPGLERRRVAFHNASTRLVSMYWVDFSGVEVHYLDIHPKENGVLHTFQRHVWIARDYDTNAFIAQYVVGDDGTSPTRFVVAA